MYTKYHIYLQLRALMLNNVDTYEHMYYLPIMLAKLGYMWNRRYETQS